MRSQPDRVAADFTLRAAMGDMLIHWLIQSLDDCWESVYDTAAPVWLSSAEQERLNQFKMAKRRRDWLLGRWTAKNLVLRYLAESTGAPPALDAIFIGADADGAPYAARCGARVVKAENFVRLPVSLSISHSHGTALCALVERLPGQEGGDVDLQENGLLSLVSLPSLGCDLELITPRGENFLDHFFTAEEVSSVRALRERDAAKGEMLTTAIWSGKEAVLKALRTGLRIDTRRITCRFEAYDLPPHVWTPFTVVVDDGLAVQFPGTWSAWWCVVDRFALTMALLEGL